MRVFLDTNVIVSAAAARGLCADVLREVLARHELVVSDVLLDEVREVLVGKIGVLGDIVSEVIALLRDGAVMASPEPAHPLPDCDPADSALISAAINGKAALFVTGDLKLQALRDALGGPGAPAIVSPREFWNRLRKP
jgi:uncharacterized protein